MIYETYEISQLNVLTDEVVLYSEMAEVERRFVNGLIRYHHPKRLLEMGVAAGAGTCVLLNAISDDLSASLVSIDSEETYYRNISKKTGYLAETYANTAQWSIIRGKDFSEIYQSFNEKFDFCIIDTAHIHPIESLNFISILPFLDENALVVLHDTCAYTKWSLAGFPKNVLMANAYCYNSIVGDKIKPVDTDYLFHCGGTANIGAVKLNADTFKYIINIFENLNLPWGMFPQQYIEPILKLIGKYYSGLHVSLFKAAVETNLRLLLNDYVSQAPIDYERVLDVLERINKCERLVFYGFGANAKELISRFKEYEIKLPDEIWDRTAINETLYDSIKIVQPLFNSVSSVDNKSTLVVNTLSDYWLKTDVEYFFRERRFLNVIGVHNVQKALLIKWFKNTFKESEKYGFTSSSVRV